MVHHCKKSGVAKKLAPPDEQMTRKGRQFDASIIPLYPLRLKKWVHLFAMYTSINTASAQH
jgi:hypothetical protein